MARLRLIDYVFIFFGLMSKHDALVLRKASELTSVSDAIMTRVKIVSKYTGTAQIIRDMIDLSEDIDQLVWLKLQELDDESLLKD